MSTVAETRSTFRLSVEERIVLDDMYQAYAAALDERRYDEWPLFFETDALYRIVPKENHDLGLPIALMHCEGQAMMRDRVVALKETVMMRPRSLRRFVTPARILSAQDGRVQARANVLLVETLHDQLTRVVLAGVYHDTVVRDGGGFRLAERLCVYDSLLLPDSLVEPV
jgi:3-phenylpropionate/cinnamic acid dioxygenase small subunit